MENITTFDPDLGAQLMQARFNHVKVLDPGAFPPNLTRNHVIDPTRPFDIEVEWELEGFLAQMWQAQAQPNNWEIRVYAESMGAGQEIQIAASSVNAINAQLVYNEKLTIDPVPLTEGNPGIAPGTISGVYKLVVTVFLNSAQPGQPYDITGFTEGPMIRIEDPV